MAVDSFARTLAAGMTQIAKDIQSDMTNMEEEFAIAKAQVGTPLTAANAAAMTDHNKIYVYVGDPAETGYTTGNWYFWNGSAWESGGVYNSTALQTDTTLSIAGMAADAKVTGDDITDLKNALTKFFALKNSDHTKISPNDETYRNLDALFTPGTYRVESAADAAALEQYCTPPTTLAGYLLVVLNTSLSSRYMQIAFINISSTNRPEMGIRFRVSTNGESWLDWQSVATGANFAPDFLPSTAYTAGQYVMKDGRLYRFTADHAAGAWTGSDAETVKVSAVLSGLEDGLMGLMSVFAEDAEVLDNGTDLDELTPGDYRVTTAESAATMVHGPSSTVGYRLFVIQNVGLTRITQIALLNSGGTAAKLSVRNKASNGWTDWQNMASTAYVNSSVSGRFSGYVSDAGEILANTDLNGVTTPGTYYSVSSSRSATIINTPVKNAGYMLFVTQTSSISRIAQIAVINTHPAKIFYRMRYNDNLDWTDWSDSPSNSIEPTGITITSNNYLTYCPNAKFADITRNAIYHISTDVPLTDGPDGDAWIGTADRTSGYVQGTLLVYSQKTNPDADESGVVQILIGYRNTDYYPTLSYRIGMYVSNAYVWSNWSKFEQNGYLHASNMIVYGGSMDKTISDLNDMPSNCIMQLDLNLDNSDAAHTLGHHPAPGVSCVAMCYAFSYTSRHGKVQTVFSLDGRFYWRYGYLQATNDYRWTAWNQCVTDSGTFMVNRGRLENGTDLNTIRDNAIYMLGGQAGAQYVNNPITSGAGYLTAKNNGNVTLQVVEALAGTRYSRYTDDGGTTWSSWI